MLKTKLEQLQSKLDEQNRLIEIMKLWNVVIESGINPEDVQSFTFRDEFLNQEQKKKNFADYLTHKSSSYTGELYFNCVIMKNGEIKQIPITRRV